jgi:N-acetyltransferase 10
LVIPSKTLLIDFDRYEIGTGAADWEDAERAVSKTAGKGGASNVTVAVKTGEKKRKVGEAVEEAYKEAEKFKEGGKKSKKHKSGKRG